MPAAVADDAAAMDHVHRSEFRDSSQAEPPRLSAQPSSAAETELTEQHAAPSVQPDVGDKLDAAPAATPPPVASVSPTSGDSPQRGARVPGRPPLAPASLQPQNQPHHHLTAADLGVEHGAHVGVPTTPVTPGTPATDDYGSQKLSVALSQQLGFEVTALWASLVGGCTSAMVLVQLAFIAAKVDGSVDWGWDTVLVPLWLFNGMVLIELSCYYLSGATEIYTDVLESRARARKMGIQACQCLCSSQKARKENHLPSTQISSRGSFSGSVRTDLPATPITVVRPKNLQELQAAATPTAVGQQDTPTLASSAFPSSGPTTTSTLEELENELEKERELKEALRKVSRTWVVSMIMIAVCYVIASSLGGRLIGHPDDFSPIIPIVFALLGEACVFGSRVYELKAVDLRDFLWLKDGIVEISDAARRTLMFFRLTTPFARIAFYVMMMYQVESSCVDKTAGCRVTVSWLYVVIPFYVLMLGSLVIIGIKATVKVRNGVQSLSGAITGVAIELLTLFCFAFTTTTAVLKLEGVIGWSLGACLAPLFFYFSFVFILCTMMGCCMAMQTVEVPTGQGDEQDGEEGEDGAHFHGVGYAMPPPQPGAGGYHYHPQYPPHEAPQQHYNQQHQYQQQHQYNDHEGYGYAQQQQPQQSHDARGAVYRHP